MKGQSLGYFRARSAGGDGGLRKVVCSRLVTHGTTKRNLL